MATVPDLAAVKAYLGDDHSWTDAEISAALASQVGDQAKKCTIPATYPDALADAVCRRVHVELSLKPLPLGFQVTLSDVNAATTKVGTPSSDSLVRDLEGPYRRRVIA